MFEGDIKRFPKIENGSQIVSRERSERMTTQDTLLISIDFTNGEDTDVLVIGRKMPNDSVKIVNAFQGEEARKLYETLIKKRG